MATLTVGKFREKLAQVLTEDLADAGIPASVELEPVPRTKLNRVYIISKHRDRLQPSEWDNLLWRIIRRHFGADADLRISTIYTVTPDELRSYRAAG